MGDDFIGLRWRFLKRILRSNLFVKSDEWVLIFQNTHSTFLYRIFILEYFWLRIQVNELQNLLNREFYRICGVSHVMNNHVQENLGILQLFLKLRHFQFASIGGRGARLKALIYLSKAIGRSLSACFVRSITHSSDIITYLWPLKRQFSVLIRYYRWLPLDT